MAPDCPLTVLRRYGRGRFYCRPEIDVGQITWKTFILESRIKGAAQRVALYI